MQSHKICISAVKLTGLAQEPACHPGRHLASPCCAHRCQFRRATGPLVAGSDKGCSGSQWQPASGWLDDPSGPVTEAVGVPVMQCNCRLLADGSWMRSSSTVCKKVFQLKGGSRWAAPVELSLQRLMRGWFSEDHFEPPSCPSWARRWWD